jgi:tetratricopeptide (TPR) repeat protein
MMSVRRYALIIVLALSLAGALAGWWYAGEMKQERQARQQAALDAGIEALENKRYDAAVSEFRSVPSSHPDGGHARYLEGSTQILLKDYAGAIPVLEEALALNPTHTRTLHALGVAHFKLGNLAVSKAYFAHVLEIDPGDEEARGLMDIMAKLERQSAPGAAEAEAGGD